MSGSLTLAAPEAAPETAVQRRRAFIAALGTTGLGTLASRVLGLLRDMATASLLGLGETAVMDAFVLALRIPNLSRRLFGEGALTACYLPVLAEQLDVGRAAAWRLASVVLVWLGLGLAGMVLLGEALCLAGWSMGADDANLRLALGLTAALLPYAWLICLAAQLAATLQALARFKAAAFSPVLLNVCWLGGAWWLAPRASADPRTRAFVLAGCILAAGVLQLLVQWWALRRCGFRLHYEPAACRAEVERIGRSLWPMLAGLGVVQLNTLLDSLLAWLLAAPPGEPQAIWWLGGLADYPVARGAAAAIYYGERFYQLPVGLVGVAAATAIFPLLSRHAARRQPGEAAADMAQALRLAGFCGLPLSVLLALAAEPAVRLAFERGEFSPIDTLRTARMVAAYAAGVWAYVSIPLLVRGFYAWGDYRTPVRVALAAVVLNLALNLTLIWPLAEVGLAVSTAVSAVVQCLTLGWLLWRKWAASASLLRAGWWPSLAATAALALAVAAVDVGLPAAAGVGTQILRLGAVVGGGTAAFFLTAWLLGSRELTILWEGWIRSRPRN